MINRRNINSNRKKLNNLNFLIFLESKSNFSYLASILPNIIIYSLNDSFIWLIFQLRAHVVNMETIKTLIFLHGKFWLSVDSKHRKKPIIFSCLVTLQKTYPVTSFLTQMRLTLSELLTIQYFFYLFILNYNNYYIF